MALSKSLEAEEELGILLPTHHSSLSFCSLHPVAPKFISYLHFQWCLHARPYAPYTTALSPFILTHNPHFMGEKVGNETDKESEE